MQDSLERKESPMESGATHETEQLRKRIAALWGAVLALAVILSGVTGYGYLTLQKHNVQLSELPGVQETLALAGQRLDAVETKLTSWAADWDAVQARLSKLDRKVAYNRELARSEAAKQAAAAEERLRAELDEQAKAVDARFVLLESGQEAERARLTQLRDEIANVRLDTGHDLGALNDQVARGERQLDELARTLDRQRVSFEATKNRTEELAPGISLRVTGTNVSHQRVKGWLWLVEDRKFLWIKDLGLQQAMVFYRKDGRGPNELVITQVSGGSVAGYLLLPGGEISGFRSASPATGGATTGAPAAENGQ